MNERAQPHLNIPPVEILITGLGPGSVQDVTLGNWQALMNARRLLLRTRHHPCVECIEQYRALESFDYLYEKYEEFESVYAAIAQTVVEAALALKAEDKRPQELGVVFAVPGHPWVGEATTPLILQQAKEAGITAAVIGGASFVEACFGAVHVDPMAGGQIVDAMVVARQHHPPVEPGSPLLIGQLFAAWLASDVKLTLMNAYPAEHVVTVIRSAGMPEQKITSYPLCELDQAAEFDHLTSLYVPPLEAGGSFLALQEIVAHLRAPDGCPWDRAQTLESLRHDLLDEAAEVLEAIDAEVQGADNTANIVEELGDLLLLPAMMVQIATEEGRFQFSEVTRGIVNKLIRRHPHVFGSVDTEDIDEIVTNWEAIKAAEKADRGEKPRGLLDGIPAGLPALEKARKLQSKAQKAGLLDRDKVAKSAASTFERFLTDCTEVTLGDFLWTLVALAEEHDLNAESALRAAAGRFRARNAEP